MYRLFWTVFFLPFGTMAFAAEKYALLIGVTTYEHARMNDAPLKYPEQDATAVAELLKESGYSVDVLIGKDATKAAVQNALTKVGREGKEGGAVLIGLFGHGVQYGQNAYFCPYTATVRQVVDSEGKTLRDRNDQIKLEPDPESLVSLKSILDALATCGASNRIILADCCRDDPSAARGRAFGSDLKISDLPRGTAALFSCSENEKAFEHDDWKHGAFTYAFLDACQHLSGSGKVRANTLSETVFDKVDQLVTDKTNGRNRQTVNFLFSGGVVDFRLNSTISPEGLKEQRRLFPNNTSLGSDCINAASVTELWHSRSTPLRRR